MSTFAEIIDQQKQVCAKFGAAFCSCAVDERVGVALATLKNEPIYGVRKKNEDGTSNWYIWGGKYSNVADFYQPFCAGHLSDLIPMVVRYLALPPGYKFIIDRSGFEDVWFEEERQANQPSEPTAIIPPPAATSSAPLAHL